MSITSNANSTFLNVDNAHLRVSGDIHATAVKVGAIEIVPGYSLESTTGIGNTTPHTVEFTNTETSLVTSGDINMLHSSNNAAIKLNSNVVTEFPRSKKLIKYPRVALTGGPSGLNSGYTQDGYTVQVSSEFSTSSIYHATYVFDDEFFVNSWISAENTYNSDGTAATATSPDTFQSINGSWIGIQLPDKIRLEYFIIRNRDSNSLRNPDTGILWAKNTTDSTWYRVYDFSSLNTSSLATNTVHVNQTIAYDEYRLQITKMEPYTVGSPAVSIGAWELFGVPEYDPDAAGVDVKVTSYPNVPNTDWLEVYYDAKDLVDGSVTSVDDLTPSGTNDGTANGGVTVSDGAFVLDGTNDYITTPALGFSGDQVHSVSLWFWSDKPQSDMTTEHGLYGIGRTVNPLNGTNSARSGLSFWDPATYSPGPLRYWHSDSSGKNFKDVRIVENTWNHVIVVYPGGGAFNIRIWLNGVEQQGVPPGSTNNDFAWDTSDHIIIGDWYTGTGTVKGQSPWDGKIANFRLFNRALSQDEIYQLYAYQKEYFGHGDLSMTLKAGRLGIGTSEPRAALDVRGDVRFYNVPHIYATDDGGYDAANEAYINFDRVESSYGIALIGTDGTFEITEQAGAGVYYVDGSVSFHQSTGTEVRNLELIIHLNGVSHHSNNRNYGLTAMKHVTGSTYSDLGVTALVKCNVGDKIRLYGKSRSSSINVHTPNNKMVIFKVQST